MEGIAAFAKRNAESIRDTLTGGDIDADCKLAGSSPSKPTKKLAAA